VSAPSVTRRNIANRRVIFSSTRIASDAPDEVEGAAVKGVPPTSVLSVFFVIELRTNAMHSSADSCRSEEGKISGMFQRQVVYNATNKAKSCCAQPDASREYFW
jgi:hypothetical protein